MDTPIFQPPAPIRPPVSFRAIEMELLVWKMIGISLPRYQHMEKSGLSPKLGSFHLKTGVAFWEGEYLQRQSRSLQSPVMSR